ncbi:MAG: exodeoxyribonuclease VII small subunit [Candidatus Saccharimonadales bacterium]
MTKKTDEFDFRAKSAELDELLAKLQSPDIQVDEAATYYEAGLKLIAELEDYLEHAENVVKKLNTKSV